MLVPAVQVICMDRITTVETDMATMVESALEQLLALSSLAITISLVLWQRS